MTSPRPLSGLFWCPIKMSFACSRVNVSSPWNKQNRVFSPLTDRSVMPLSASHDDIVSRDMTSSLILDWLFVLQEEMGNDTREQTVCLKFLVYPTFLSKADKTWVRPRPVPWSPVFPVPTSVNKLPAPVSPNNIANPSQKLEGKIIFDRYNMLMDIVKRCHLIIKAL